MDKSMVVKLLAEMDMEVYRILRGLGLSDAQAHDRMAEFRKLQKALVYMLSAENEMAELLNLNKDDIFKACERAYDEVLREFGVM